MNNEAGGTPNADGGTPEATQTQAPAITPEVQALIDAAAAEAAKKANAEAAEYRHKLKAIEDAAKAADEAKMKEKQQFKELFEARETELAAVKAERDALQPFREQVETYRKQRHAELLGKIPEAQRPAVADFSVEQLEKVVTLLPTAHAHSPGAERQTQAPQQSFQPSVPFAGNNGDVQTKLLQLLGG